MKRRELIQKIAIGGGLTLAGESSAAPGVTGHGQRVANVLNFGADPTAKRDSAAAIQHAIDLISVTGGIIYIPAGIYLIASTLNWINHSAKRSSGIHFQGDGCYSSILQSNVKSGPILRIRGMPEAATEETTFFFGGGIRDLCFDGKNGGADCDAIEVSGWWHAEIESCIIRWFSRHGIRALADSRINPNPDFSASILSLNGVQFEHCGGWGFMDQNPQCAPAWRWTQCIFIFCKLGGVYVQSSSHGFIKCSFAGCGWLSESSPAGRTGYGIFFAGNATMSSRHWVEGCEFDTNRTAHVAIRFMTCSTFINNRFIFNDRYGYGGLCPATGVEIGSGDERAEVRSVEFRQNFFRFDLDGEVSAFVWSNIMNVRDIDISNSLYSYNRRNSNLKLTRYGGKDWLSRARYFGYTVRDRELPDL